MHYKKLIFKTLSAALMLSQFLQAGESQVNLEDLRLCAKYLALGEAYSQNVIIKGASFSATQVEQDHDRLVVLEGAGKTHHYFTIPKKLYMTNDDFINAFKQASPLGKKGLLIRFAQQIYGKN